MDAPELFDVKVATVTMADGTEVLVRVMQVTNEEGDIRVSVETWRAVGAFSSWRYRQVWL